MATEKFICIHGHFYQPPRENAWLEVIEVQDSAHPFHDWNERVSAECYGPNAASRILDSQGIIKNIVNNYSKISFNFGPTLLSWMEKYDVKTYQAILEADQESMSLFNGHGAAIAQVYNHIISPLANTRDKETQIIWGIRDFTKRFKRLPEGMWLAETAVDVESLELLAKHDIKYTILAPRQAKSIRKIGSEAWSHVTTETIDTRRPYLCNLPSGKSITIFYYDGDIAQGVAFGGLLYDGMKFAKRMLDAFDPNSQEPQLVHTATDGETYGHHHMHGDMALAFCLDYLSQQKDITLTNYGNYLAHHKPLYETIIYENSSWSCVHGVERWRSDCGCHTGGLSGWNQAWRKPLREALDWLRDELIIIYEREGSKLLKDPWLARDEYIDVILDRGDESVYKFLERHCIISVESNRVLRLMEMQRNAMLMYTSCGWFFSEISGIETVQILQYACRALQLVSQISEVDLEEAFIERIRSAKSNLPTIDSGEDVYRKYVLPSKKNLLRVGMHFAVSSIFEEDPENSIFNYTTNSEMLIKKEAGLQRLALGITNIKSTVTRSEKRVMYGVLYLGQHNILGYISLDMSDATFKVMQQDTVNAFEEGRLGDIISLLQTYFSSEKFTIWHLFQDEKRKVFNLITQQSMKDLEDSLRRIYNRDYPLINALANNHTPIPTAYHTTFKYILNVDLVRCFQTEKINVRQVERIIGELQRWKFTLEDKPKLERLAGRSIYRELKRIHSEGETTKRLERLNRLLLVLRNFDVRPVIYKSQNLYFQIAQKNKEGENIHSDEWLNQFNMLGDNLGVKVLV
jgi:alpha-amylase/alpha-mannosidase (GH57 family)